jgi:L-asparagine transporter-like permease
MSLTLTSYMGIEIIGITAGEALEPARTVPRAIRGVTIRLILFYVLSITVMLTMTPWDRMGSGITGSPFVLAFAKAGVPYAAKIMNVVVISAALSSANTNLYLTTRILFSLSQDGYAPKRIGALGTNGVPYFALALSTSGMVAAIVLAIFAPGRAFLLLYGVAVAGMFFVWTIILIAHLSFRNAIGMVGISQLPIRLRCAPLSQIAALIALAGILLGTFYVDGLRYSVPSFFLFLSAITAFYRTFGRRHFKEKQSSEPKSPSTGC